MSLVLRTETSNPAAPIRDTHVAQQPQSGSMYTSMGVFARLASRTRSTVVRASPSPAPRTKKSRRVRECFIKCSASLGPEDDQSALGCGRSETEQRGRAAVDLCRLDFLGPEFTERATPERARAVDRHERRASGGGVSRAAQRREGNHVIGQHLVEHRLPGALDIVPGEEVALETRLDTPGEIPIEAVLLAGQLLGDLSGHGLELEPELAILSRPERDRRPHWGKTDPLHHH